EIAASIGVGIGDVVTVITSSSRLSPIGPIPKRKRFIVTGIFNTGLYEFDSSTVLVWLESAQKFFGLGEEISYIQVRIDNIFDAPKIGNKITEIIPPLLFSS
ncbi:unnamed protein product, partial [marine sediment metagenome]